MSAHYENQTNAIIIAIANDDAMRRRIYARAINLPHDNPGSGECLGLWIRDHFADTNPLASGHDAHASTYNALLHYADWIRIGRAFLGRAHDDARAMKFPPSGRHSS